MSELHAKAARIGELKSLLDRTAEPLTALTDTADALVTGVTELGLEVDPAAVYRESLDTVRGCGEALRRHLDVAEERIEEALRPNREVVAALKRLGDAIAQAMQQIKGSVEQSMRSVAQSAQSVVHSAQLLADSAGRSEQETGTVLDQAYESIMTAHEEVLRVVGGNTDESAEDIGSIALPAVGDDRSFYPDESGPDSGEPDFWGKS